MSEAAAIERLTAASPFTLEMSHRQVGKGEWVMAVGISDRLVADGLVDRERFAATMRAGRPVGMCACGGLLDGRIERTRRVVYFTTTCRDCGSEMAAPGGRVNASPPLRDGEVRPVDPALAQEWARRDRALLGESEEDDAA